MGGAVFILALAVLWQRRSAALPNLLRWQVFALAAASASQLWQIGAPWWGIVAIAAVLLAYGVAIPITARRWLGSLIAGETSEAGHTALLLLLCFVLVGLAVVVANALAPLPWRANFAVALAVALLGLLTMAVRPAAGSQLAGLLCLVHGVLLGAVTTIGPLRG